MDRAVYMDYNATAPLKAAVREAMAAALDSCGNPSSVHRFGRLARRTVEEARMRVAALVGAEASEVVFTSSGTEANNLAIRGAGRARVIVSAVEHDSVLRAAGCATLRAEIAPVDPDGVVNLEALAELLQSRPDDGGFDGRQTLVAVMLANNETGVIEPVAEAAEIAHAHGALLHCDAIQAVGKIPIEVDSLGADLLSLSAHKTGGPQGAGTLVVRQGVALTPQLAGGGQERGLRAGTENVAAIAGFGAACDLAGEDLEGQARLARLRDDLEARIGAIAPGAKVFGRGAPRLANTSCFTMPGVSSETQVMALDLAGIAVSAGAACSSGKVAASHVLRAMEVAEDEASSAIRVSLGWRSRRQEIDKFLAAWRGLYARAGAKSASAAPAA